MRAVVTVIGKDAVGILGKVSTKCAEYNANVIEVTQSVLQDLFAMIMLVDKAQLRFCYHGRRTYRAWSDNGCKNPYHARGYF